MCSMRSFQRMRAGGALPHGAIVRDGPVAGVAVQKRVALRILDERDPGPVRIGQAGLGDAAEALQARGAAA